MSIITVCLPYSMMKELLLVVGSGAKWLSTRRSCVFRDAIMTWQDGCNRVMIASRKIIFRVANRSNVSILVVAFEDLGSLRLGNYSSPDGLYAGATGRRTARSRSRPSSWSTRRATCTSWTTPTVHSHALTFASSLRVRPEAFMIVCRSAF